jgi:hypothetical protein
MGRGSNGKTTEYDSDGMKERIRRKQKYKNEGLGGKRMRRNRRRRRKD